MMSPFHGQGDIKYSFGVVRDVFLSVLCLNQSPSSLVGFEGQGEEYMFFIFLFLIYLLIILLQLSHFCPFIQLHPAHPLPPTFPPYSSCPWVIFISPLASTFPTLFLPYPCLFSTYHLCYLFSVLSPSLSLPIPY